MVHIFKAIREGIRRPRKAAETVHRAARSGAAQAVPQDVWEWVGPKYRIRSIILLLVNAALFAGLGCFAYWLRSGEFSPFFVDGYWKAWWTAFDPTHDQQLTLIDYLLYPIPVDEVRFMMVIMGLVLASLTAIPILVSMLYRFPFSLIFTLIICFVAILPWLALVVTFSCWLARWKPLRFSFRYATALIALIPVAGYYTMATRGSTALAGLSPMEGAKLYLPWVLALIAACIVMAIVLLIARWVNHRPGAIAPLLLVMFAMPVVLFEGKVGRSELYYRLLRAKYGPYSTTHFVDQDATELIVREAERRLAQVGNLNATPTVIMEQVKLAMPSQIDQALLAAQNEAILACSAFRDRNPESRYVPNTFYIEGRASDMRFDRKAFTEKRHISFYHDFPRDVSKETWRKLCEEYSDSPLATIAGYRLAILETRGGDVGTATKVLDHVITQGPKLARAATPPSESARWTDLLFREPPPDWLDVEPRTWVQEAHKLQELLKENRDHHQNDKALQRLFSLDPRGATYRKELGKLLKDIRAGKLATRLQDNVQLLLTLESTKESQSLRIDRLKAVIEEFSRFDKSDALPQALYELGLAYQVDNRPDEASEVYAQVVSEFSGSAWASEAQGQLAAMGVRIQVATE
jgi:hypothetical protein